MAVSPRVTMSMRELERLKCVQGVVDSHLGLFQAANVLQRFTHPQLSRFFNHRTSDYGTEYTRTSSNVGPKDKPWLVWRLVNLSV